MKNLLKPLLSIVLVLFSFGIFSQTSGTLTFTATTINQFGTYQPKNIMAIWVTNASGTFIKTLKKMAGQRVQYLYQWRANSASNVTDAITGSTLPNHQTHTVSWNGKNVSQALVADGDYKVWIEFTDGDYQGAYTSFTWTKGPNAQSLAPTDSKLSGISLTWTPTPSSIAEKGLPSNLSVFPNPFKNQLNFVVTNSNDRIFVDLYDITGKKVASLDNKTTTITWDGTSANGERLRNGVYLYNITMGDKKYSGRVIISN